MNLYVKVYYSTLNGSAIAYETFEFDKFQKNKDKICEELLSYDTDPMDLDIQVFDKENYYVGQYEDLVNEGGYIDL